MFSAILIDKEMSWDRLLTKGTIGEAACLDLTNVLAGVCRVLMNAGTEDAMRGNPTKELQRLATFLCWNVAFEESTGAARTRKRAENTFV